MVRGLALGTLAFGVVFVAERRFGSVGKDLARYDAMRAMSGDPPLVRQLFDIAYKAISEFAARKGGAGDLLTSLTRDIVRYATIRGM
ncbi:MAG: hypothetical protein NVSMB19_16170 [Vulcanimicrobiaceae bacterium]